MSSSIGGGQVLNGRQQFLDGNGRPLAGGKVEFYLPGTLTPVTTYFDRDLTIPNTNPVVLDAGGMATIFAKEMVRQILKDREGNLIWDKVSSVPLMASQLTANIPTIADLRLNTLAWPQVYVQGYYAPSDGGEGLFRYVPSDVVSTDDGGSIIVDADGHRYYRIMDKAFGRVSVMWWGAKGDGVTDDGAPVQTCLDYADENSLTPYFPAQDFYSSIALSMVTYGFAPGIHMDGRLIFEGGFSVPALTLGRSGANKNTRKRYGPLRVQRRTIASWLDDTDIGIRIYNCDNCVVDVAQADGFYIGLQTYGDETGFEDSDVRLGRLVDNAIALDIRTGTASGWNNSNRYYGGQFACASSTNTSLPRYGVRFSRETGAYNLHNTHSFYSPSFELQNGYQGGGPGSSVLGIPFKFDVAGRSVTVFSMRTEGCSPYLAHFTAEMLDCSFYVAYSSNGSFPGVVGDAYLLDFLYDSGLARRGGTFIPFHQAAAAVMSDKPVIGIEAIRSSAFRWNSTDIGFDRMACLSSSPSGPPTTLSGFAFPGLPDYTLGNDEVTMPTSRGLGFVLVTADCKEFGLWWEGVEMRPAVIQFDAGQNVLDATYPVYFSNMGTVYDASLGGWKSGAVPDNSTLTKLERVTLSPECSWAIIGLMSDDASAAVRSFRILAPPSKTASAIWRSHSDDSYTYRWGSRELTSITPHDFAVGISAGSSTSVDVTLTGVSQGDFVQSSFAKNAGFQNGSAVFHAQVAGADTVRVTVFNYSGSTITLLDGNIYVRAIKPRV